MTGRTLTGVHALLDELLDLITADVPGALGAVVSVGDRVVAAHGLAGEPCDVVTLPIAWESDAALVLTVRLDRPATEGTLTALRRYERLTALAAGEARQDRTEQMLDLLQSRAALEEAKGIVIALRRCAPDEAWETLRRASQQFNVKVRELAVALVELLAGAPAPQPDGDRTIHPSAAARAAAGQLLLAFEDRPGEAGLPTSG